MLDILEGIVQAAGYKYHRMDGCTAVAQRSRMMHDFNNNPSIFVFLLTTKARPLPPPPLPPLAPPTYSPALGISPFRMAPGAAGRRTLSA